MFRTLWRYRVPLTAFAVFLPAACGQGPSSGQAASTTTVGADWQVTPDPCRLIETIDESMPVPGRIIERLRVGLAAGIDPVPLLERIGWFYVSQARTRSDPGLYTLAAAASDCIKKQHPDSAEAMLLEGHVLHSRHRFREAERVARRLVAMRGLWFDHALLGDALFDLGRLEEAADAYQEMMSQRPGPQAYLRAGKLRWTTGDLSGAIEMMRLALGSGAGRDPGAEAWTYTELARLEFQDRRMSESATHLHAALRLAPDYVPALVLRARLALSRDAWGEALADLEQAQEKTTLPEVQWLLADVLRRVGQEMAADAVVVKLSDTANREDPRTVALFLATEGLNPALALEVARTELGVRQDVFTLDAMAWASLAAGDVPTARRFALQATAAGTKEARLFLHAGIIAARTGFAEEAVGWLNRALELRHTLFPGERDLLFKEFAVLRPQIGPGLGETSMIREDHAPPGDRHEQS